MTQSTTSTTETTIGMDLGLSVEVEVPEVAKASASVTTSISTTSGKAEETSHTTEASITLSWDQNDGAGCACMKLETMEKKLKFSAWQEIHGGVTCHFSEPAQGHYFHILQLYNILPDIEYTGHTQLSLQGS